MNIKDLFKHPHLLEADRLKQNNKLDRITYREIALWFLLISFAGLLIYVAYQLWWPVTPVRIDKIAISKPIMTRGEDVYYQFEGEKFMPIPVHAVVELTNGERITIMNYVADNSTGILWKRRAFIVPYHVIPGKYRLKWTGIYQINALRTVTYTAYSDEITIR